MIADGYIKVSGFKYPILKLNEKSKEVLFSKKKVYIRDLKEENKKEKIDNIYMVGICTDICVLSNAIMIKNALLDTEVTVIEDLCRATSQAAHEASLVAMASCQVNIIKFADFRQK